MRPACTGLDVRRLDDKTLAIQSRGSNLFSCDNLGAVHIGYALNAADHLILGGQFKKGDRYPLKGLTVEILEVDKLNLPSRVAFHFDHSLGAPDFRWLWFNWRTRSIEPFELPAIGQSVALPGPKE